MTVSLLLLVETHLVRKNVTPKKKITPGKKMSHLAKNVPQFIFDMDCHLNAVVEFSNPVADVLLLLCEGKELL